MRFVAGFATLAAPLHALTKKNVASEWTDATEDSFIQLRSALTTLAYSRFDDIMDWDMEGMNEQGELRNEEEEQAEPEVLREEPQSPPVRRYHVRNRLPLFRPDYIPHTVSNDISCVISRYNEKSNGSM